MPVFIALPLAVLALFAAVFVAIVGVGLIATAPSWHRAAAGLVVIWADLSAWAVFVYYAIRRFL